MRNRIQARPLLVSPRRVSARPPRTFLLPALAGAALSMALAAPARAYEQAEVAGAGVVSGTVTFGGSPKPPLNVDKNRDVCGAQKPDESISVSGGKLKNVVISIEGISRGPRKPLSRTATIDQRGCLFVPHVQAVSAGGTYELLNGDSVFHNVKLQSGGRSLHNVGMPFKGMRVKKSVAGPGVVKLSCDAHSWMRGWVIVKDHPYVAITDDAGRFTLEGVPPGTYTVEAWHEELGTKRAQVTVPPKGEATVNFAY